MNYKKNILFIVFLTTLCGCASTSSMKPDLFVSPSFQKAPDIYKKIVVVVVDNSRSLKSRGTLRQIEDEFMKVAIAKDYDVVTRSDKDKLIEEMHFANSMFTDTVGAAQIGKMFNVPGVLIVSVNNVSTREYQPLLRMEGKRYYATVATISARYISTAQAQVLFVLNHTIEYKGNDRNQGELAVISCAKAMSVIMPSWETRS